LAVKPGAPAAVASPIDGGDEPTDEQVFDAEHERGDVAVSTIGENESCVVAPVPGWWGPALIVAQLKLMAVGALNCGGRELMAESSVHDDLLNVHIPGLDDVPGRHASPSPIGSRNGAPRAGGLQQAEIGHLRAIMGMPQPLHLLLAWGGMPATEFF
jgi:hypothetical protein